MRHTVLDWLKAQGISPRANRGMVLKTILVSWGAAAYATILTSAVPWSARWCSCLFLSLVLGSLGMAIGHDALHGAYSNRPWAHHLPGLAFEVAGANGHIWKVSHNVVHHTDANVDGVDLDIDLDPLVRMASSTRWSPFHRYQRVDALGLTALATIHWLLAKDFVHFARQEAAWTSLVTGLRQRDEKALTQARALNDEAEQILKTLNRHGP